MSTFTDKVENLLADELYDGGSGALSDFQMETYRRNLAEKITELVNEEDFRRSEVPEGLRKAALEEVDRREEYAEAHGHPAFQDEASAFSEGAEWATGIRRPGVPEPSAECASCQGECGGGRHCCENCAHTQPQGEPSDAKVAAAALAYNTFPSNYLELSEREQHEARIRAALRAAGEAE